MAIITASMIFPGSPHFLEKKNGFCMGIAYSREANKNGPVLLLGRPAPHLTGLMPSGIDVACYCAQLGGFSDTSFNEYVVVGCYSIVVIICNY